MCVLHEMLVRIFLDGSREVIFSTRNQFLHKDVCRKVASEILKIFCPNGPLVGAPGVLIDAFCMKSRCASFWRGPGGQNRKKLSSKTQKLGFSEVLVSCFSGPRGRPR